MNVPSPTGPDPARPQVEASTATSIGGLVVRPGGAIDGLTRAPAGAPTDDDQVDRVTVTTVAVSIGHGRRLLGPLDDDPRGQPPAVQRRPVRSFAPTTGCRRAAPGRAA